MAVSCPSASQPYAADEGSSGLQTQRFTRVHALSVATFRHLCMRFSSFLSYVQLHLRSTWGAAECGHAHMHASSSCSNCSSYIWRPASAVAQIEAPRPAGRRQLSYAYSSASAAGRGSQLQVRNSWVRLLAGRCTCIFRTLMPTCSQVGRGSEEFYICGTLLQTISAIDPRN